MLRRRYTHRVGFVPADAADVATFCRRTLVRPQTVEVWPNITHNKLGPASMTRFLVISGWCYGLIHVYKQSIRTRWSVTGELLPVLRSTCS